MFKQTIKLFFLVVCFCSLNMSAQISVTSTVVCLPSGINFSVTPGSSYLWNFGNSQTSTLQFPNVAYTSPGNYTVTCVVGGTTTYSIVIKAAPKPTPAFTFAQPSSGCAPKTVTFTSTSTGGGGSAIVGHSWVFGDGGSGSTTTPTTTYAYTTAGSYSITLSVTDANGCGDNITVGTVNVSAPPTVIISSNPSPLGACSAPYSAAFSGTSCSSGSPTGGGLSYSWSFPGGSTTSSSLQNPGTINYNVTGNYTASLTVTDNNNCSASTAVNFAVSQPTLNATIPGTVCLNTTFSISAASNVSQIFWNFGSPTPGSTLTLNNSTVFITPYTTPGVYTVNISTQPSPGSTCTASQTKTVFVQQVVANFTHTPPSFTCSPTFTAGYTNLSSSNAVSFTWTATNYNGQTTSTSTAVNPTFTLVQGSLNPYTIYNTFSSQVTLIAQSAAGCLSTYTTMVFDSIRRPTARFNKDKKEGCAPLVVKFRDTSFTNTSVYPITSYTWNNGASPPTLVTGVVPPPITNPTFTYNTPGTYTPYLIVQTATGCIDTSYIDTVTVVNPPNINFAFSPSVACWNTPVTVTMTATPPTTPAIQHWHVDSDNGFFSGCISQNVQQWNFTHPGVHTFTVSGYHHSCKGTNTSTASVLVNGPIAQSRFVTNCTNRKSVDFHSYLMDVQTATLNFGDNSSVTIAGTPGSSISHSVSHTYSASGNYTAILTSTNAITSCTPAHTYTMLVKVRDAVATFSLPSVGCASTSVSFTGTPSQDVLIGCERGYEWHIDNLPPNDTTAAIISHTFTSVGIHTVMLLVKDENSCADTTKHTLRISAAAPQFTFGQNPICSGGTVALINSTSGVPDPITNWQWNFGDGTPSSSVQSPTHTYVSLSPGQTFTVSLTATNSQGCMDTKTQTITVSNPIAFINPNPSAPCMGSPVLFTGPISSGATYTFNFGAGTTTLTTTSYTASYTYTNAGNYTASLTIQDASGCTNSAQTAVTVHSMTPASFTLSSPNATGTNNICAGSPISYTATTQSTFPLNYSWNIATLNSSVVTSFVPANASGPTVISLTVSTSPLGCSSVISKTVNVYKASANLNIDKATVCLGNSIKFNVKDSSTVYNWTWFFGDGDTLKEYTGAGTPTVSHTYTYYPSLANGNTTVTLIYYSPQNACKYYVQQPIQIVKIDANFNRNNEILPIDSVHCIGISDSFSNTTVGSGGYTFSWNFGDGNNGSGQNANHTYSIAGVYQVTLNVVDPVNNCTGYAIKNMTIHPLPNVNILTLDSICANAPFVLGSNVSPNVVTYSWSPVAGLVSPNSPTTSATSTITPVTYSLAVTDVNGCSNVATKNIYVQLPPKNLNWDTTVIIGQNIPMSGYAGTNFSYTWTPLTDLTCTNCIYPTSTSTVDITYTLVIEDGLGCFKTTNTFSIHVDPKATVDVPTAFTPNGDGTNDVIYVAGWGIKRLNYFRIFNRWGQLLFETNDIKTGWDGFFNGIPQNMETYIYQVSVETYIDKEPILKTGSFKLIR